MYDLRIISIIWLFIRKSYRTSYSTKLHARLSGPSSEPHSLILTWPEPHQPPRLPDVQGNPASPTSKAISPSRRPSLSRPPGYPEKIFFKIEVNRLGNREKFLNFAPLLEGALPPLGQTQCIWLGAKEFRAQLGAVWLGHVRGYRTDSASEESL